MCLISPGGRFFPKKFFQMDCPPSFFGKWLERGRDGVVRWTYLDFSCRTLNHNFNSTKQILGIVSHKRPFFSIKTSMHVTFHSYKLDFHQNVTNIFQTFKNKTLPRRHEFFNFVIKIVFSTYHARRFLNYDLCTNLLFLSLKFWFIVTFFYLADQGISL